MKLPIRFVFLFLLSTFSGVAQISKLPEPKWIQAQTYETTPNIDTNDISNGSIILLYNEQVNIPQEEGYLRFVTKIVDNVGIQDASSIAISYDPTYQALRIHHITITRDGNVIDKLNLNDFQIVRREPNADSYIYDGSMTAILNLSDVRTGDIIDYSYSVKGFNPIHNGIFSRMFYLNDSEPIGKVAIAITSRKPLYYKTVNTSQEPEITTSGDLKTYKWESTITKKTEYEVNTPNWKLIYQTLFVSQFKSWEDVINWGVAVFDVKTPLSKALSDKIATINSSYKTEGKKIKATLDFVQNEIRYLGVESGIGSYKPFSPNKVFEQRYGDCKDKSLLMVTMLKAMHIEAYPMLVNTALKHTILDVLPSSRLFDHCVVKVIDGAQNNFWYDPTMSNQGGNFKTTYFPNYENGLVLKAGATEFDEIHSFANNLVEVTDTYVLEAVGKGATLDVTSVYYENQADAIRSYFKNNSIATIKKDFKTYYSNYRNSVTVLEDPKFEDDSIENKFTVRESYQLDSIWKPMVENKNNISVEFSPSGIIDVLLSPSDVNRKTPFELYYPITKRHNIQVKLPSQWGIKNYDYTISSKAFYYEYSSTYDKSERLLNINHYYKSQNSYVPVDEFKQYYNDIKKIENNISYYIYIDKRYASKVFKDENTNTSTNNSTTGFGSLSMVALIVWLVIIGGIIYYFVSRK